MLEILDTAGTDQFTAMRDLYMKNGHGFLLVYSVTSEASFHAIDDLHTQMLNIKDCNAVPCVLVGNKVDLEDQRVVTFKEAERKASKLGCQAVIESSAKTRTNVDAAFMEVVRQVLTLREQSRAAKPKHNKSKCSIL